MEVKAVPGPEVRGVGWGLYLGLGKASLTNLMASPGCALPSQPTGSPVKEAGKEGEETLGEFEEVVPQEKILQKTSDIKEQDSVEQPVEPDTEELFVKESREGTEEVEEEDNSEDDNSVEETEKQRIEKETGRL